MVHRVGPGAGGIFCTHPRGTPLPPARLVPGRAAICAVTSSTTPGYLPDCLPVPQERHARSIVALEGRGAPACAVASRTGRACLLPVHAAVPAS
jgi:hypothetical protein